MLQASWPVIPVMKENRERRFGRLHHVVVLFPKQQAEPAAQVSDLLQLGAAPPQEAPQVSETLLDVFTSLERCHKIAQVKRILALPAGESLYYSQYGAASAT